MPKRAYKSALCSGYTRPPRALWYGSATRGTQRGSGCPRRRLQNGRRVEKHLWADAARLQARGSEHRLLHGENRDVALTDLKTWAAIRSLFKKSYWERLWVVQEATSSRLGIVQWGDAEIPWTWIGMAACLIRHDDEKAEALADLQGVYNACLMFLLPGEDWKSTQYLDLMRLLLRFQVTEQRDRAFAILGLPGLHTGVPGSTFIQPDYDLPLEELYVKIAETIIATHENPVDILSAVKHESLIDESRPSWVPRWNVTFLRSINGSHRAPMRFRSGGELPPGGRPVAVLRDDGRNVFRARGHRVGRVCHATAVLGLDDISGPGYTSQWLQRRQEIPQYSAPDAAMRALCTTITAGQDWYGRLVFDTASLRQHLADFAAFSASTWKMEWKKAPRGKRKSSARRFFHAAKNVCVGRKFFQALDGSLGVGPASLRPGDDIILLQGGSVPYIVRRTWG